MSDPRKANGNGRWRAVTRHEPCPACGGADWCAWTPEGDVLRCMRPGSGEPPAGMRKLGEDADGGTRYGPMNGSAGASGYRLPKPPSCKVKPAGVDKLDLPATLERLRSQLTDERLAELASSTGLPGEAWAKLRPGWCEAADLRLLKAGGAGWSDDYPAGTFAFAEHEGRGKPVGLSLRAMDGRKGSPSSAVGCKRGLIVPPGIAEASGPVLIVEGASDVAGCIALGIAAVGRPSNRGGASDLAELLDGIDDVLVVGERDAKEGGAWPGRDGAKAVASQLAGRWREPVSWTLPPTGVKDVREWHAANPDADAGVLVAALKAAAKEVKPGKPPKQADAMVALAAEAELFHTPGDDGKGYATLTVPDPPEAAAAPHAATDPIAADHADYADRPAQPSGSGFHRETWRIGSAVFRRWLAARYYRATGKTPGGAAVEEAVSVLAGVAMHDGPTLPVAVRLAGSATGGDDDAVYLDLADAAWRVVRVTAESWQVIDGADCPVRFIRRRGLLPLPEPVRGGSLDELRDLVNVPDDDDWALVLGWLVSALRPEGPMDYPLLVVNGEAGSAKSTLSRYARSLIDPNVATLRTPPKDERDLAIAAKNAWALAFDNLSGIGNTMADAMCRLATGGGFGTRELYSDDEETLLDAKRPIIINGIDDLLGKADLASRALQLFLPPIPSDRRRAKRDLDATYERARPRVLGALLDAVSLAMANLADVDLPDLPRMADVAEWVVAAEPALGLDPGTFTAAYADNREAATEQAIDGSPIGPVLVNLIDTITTPAWTGTTTELLQALIQRTGEGQRKARGWPGNAKALGNALRRLAPALRTAGYTIAEPPRVGRGRDKRREWQMGREAQPHQLGREGDQRSARSASTANGPHDPDNADPPRTVADRTPADADHPPHPRSAPEAVDIAPDGEPAASADHADRADRPMHDSPKADVPRVRVRI